MADSQTPAPPLDPDPEIAPLLHFEPVARATRRHDGWSPERQRGFIAALARLGDVDRAAHSVGRTSSGVWKVRTSAGAEGFSESWDAALELFHARNPGISRRGGRAPARYGAPPAPEPEEPDPAEVEARTIELLQRIFRKYLLKLGSEREARLEGRIVEADYYVRQLTFMEILLDLGGWAKPLLDRLAGPDRHPVDIAATPMSVHLDGLRRALWAAMDEPERPPLGPLGEHDDEQAFGEPTHYNSARDGDQRRWKEEGRRTRAARADAQRAWEEKAKADSEAWRARIEARGGAPSSGGSAGS
jgi:hypothetical protein